MLTAIIVVSGSELNDRYYVINGRPAERFGDDLTIGFKALKPRPGTYVDGFLLARLLRFFCDTFNFSLSCGSRRCFQKSAVLWKRSSSAEYASQ